MTQWLRSLLVVPGACMLCGAGQCCASHSTPMPAVFRALVIPVRQIWPEPANKGMEPPR